MRADAWRCGECGSVLPGGGDVEAHFATHPVPPGAVPRPTCRHAPLLVDVTPSRVFLAIAGGDLGEGLSLHRGWAPLRVPPALRDIVETENASTLATPGWYFPHTQASAAALDRIYHGIVRADAAAAQQSRPRALSPLRPTLGRSGYAAAGILTADPKRRRRLAASVELASGIVCGVVGANLMYLCTSYVPFDGCDTRAYGFPGMVLLLLGIGVGVFGLGSLVASLGNEPTEMPPGWRPGDSRIDPSVQAGVERTAKILWAAILLAALVAIEAFPIYNLVLLTSAGSHPTFNLGAFLVDMAFFAVADLIVVFLAVTYSSSA